MRKQISIAVKNELTVRMENKFPASDVSEIVMSFDYLKQNEIEECLEQATLEQVAMCINRKFKDAKIRAARLK